jgi:putative hemolysin
MDSALLQAGIRGAEGESTRPYPPHPEGLPPGIVETRRYSVRFARDAEDLDSLLRLRYRVFNLELGEGLDASRDSQRDRDAFDAHCHHLMVTDLASGEAIGTYRMQTLAMARAGIGFYTDTIFDLGSLPDSLLAEAIETGRACISAAHRNGRVLFLLWQGLAMYLQHSGSRYLFGCSSLTSQDPEEGLATRDLLRAKGLLHRHYDLAPRRGYECEIVEPSIRLSPKGQIPQLMGLYLNAGARVCGGPALDRDFKTIDFMTLLDIEDFDPRTRRKIFGECA